MKIRPVGVKLFYADGQILKKLIVTFRNFSNALQKKVSYYLTRNTFGL